jgi:hypothetical protein
LSSASTLIIAICRLVNHCSAVIRAGSIERGPLDRLALGSLPTLVVSGGWDIAPREAREIAGAALRVGCNAIARRLNAEQAVFPGGMHNPQLLGKPFSDRFREFLRSATADT